MIEDYARLHEKNAALYKYEANAHQLVGAQVHAQLERLPGAHLGDVGDQGHRHEVVAVRRRGRARALLPDGDQTSL